MDGSKVWQTIKRIILFGRLNGIAIVPLILSKFVSKTFLASSIHVRKSTEAFVAIVDSLIANDYGSAFLLNFGESSGNFLVELDVNDNAHFYLSSLGTSNTMRRETTSDSSEAAVLRRVSIFTGVDIATCFSKETDHRLHIGDNLFAILFHDIKP